MRELSRLFGFLTVCGAMLLSLCVTACHKPHRDNPMDPALTVPVEILSAVMNDTTGVVTLTWTPYKGTEPFAAYRVLRREPTSTVVDTVDSIADAAQTSYVDSTLRPNTDYVYGIAVVNTNGFSQVSEERRASGYSAGTIELLDANVDRSTGGVTLRWTQYRGARFGAYVIGRRRTGEETYERIGMVATVSDTSFVDPSIPTDSDLFYRVVVDAAGSEWPSNRVGPVSFSLTPVRLLSATVSPTAGTVRLAWSSYVGPGFQGYEVRRRRAGDPDDATQLLGVLAALPDTTFTDTTLRADLDYVHTVAVRLGDRGAVVSNGLGRRLDLPSISLQSVDYSSGTASATLKWTRYRGPRFRAYQVMRGAKKPVEVALQSVREIPDITQTSFVDSSLKGNTEYVHNIVALTDSSEQVYTQSISGGFHRHLASWPVDMASGDYGRLYIEPNDRIVLLLASSDQVRLCSFDQNGRVLEEQVLLDTRGTVADPLGVSTSLTSQGVRLLSVADGATVRVLSFRQDGSPLFEDPVPLFADSLSELSKRLSENQEKAAGKIEFLVEHKPMMNVVYGEASHRTIVDNVAVLQDGNVEFEDDFTDGNSKEWSVRWTRFDHAAVLYAISNSLRDYFSTISRVDPVWKSFRLEADVRIVGGDEAHIRMGDQMYSASSTLELTLGPQLRKALFTWSLVSSTPPIGVVQVVAFEEAFSVVAGIPYRVSLEAANGRIAVSIGSSIHWSAPRDLPSTWVSVVSVDGGALYVADGRRFHTIGRADEIQEVIEPVSEARTWQGRTGRGSGTLLGICEPQKCRVRFGLTSRGERTIYPISLDGGVTTVGEGFGTLAGQLTYPISFSPAPDGRIFVLDAGSARIQVFSDKGKYITEWGHSGGDYGEFSFWSDTPTPTGRFAGSIAVDSQGAVYVFDPGNKRIQKFSN